MRELGPEARALIERVAEHDGPSRADRERIRRALAASLAAASTTATAGALAAGAAKSASAVLTKSLGASQIAFWVFVGGAVGTAVTVPLVLRQERQTTSMSVPAPPRPSVAKPALRSRAKEPPASSVSDPKPPPAPRPVSPAPRPAAPLDTAAFAPEEAASGGLRAETRLLERAQQARAQGHPGVALETLGEYAVRFPGGVLKSESLALTVLCLCESNRVAEAQALAERIVAADPSSPLVARLSRSCVQVPSR